MPLSRGVFDGVTVNYSAVKAQKRIIARDEEALFVSSFIMVAGYFLEIFNASVMSGKSRAYGGSSPFIQEGKIHIWSVYID